MKAAPKEDFLRECMGQFGTAPIDDFVRAFCLVCANRECSRSAANNSQFDQRVMTWHDRLFLNVPRAEDGDSRFDQIRSKKFLPMEGTVGGTLTGTAPRFEVISPEPEPTPVLNAVPTPESTAVEEFAPIVAPAPAPAPAPADQGNTPFQQGSFLPGKEGEKIMEPGGTFTFGSDE